jgi:hypothetical protein
MLRIILALTVGSVLFASAGPVVAQKGQSKSSKEKAAKKACSVGDYQKGVEILADIYVDTNDPAYVYNQGRCYQQNGQFKEAIQRFREYLRKAQGLPGSGSADAEKNVAECEAALEREAPLPAPGPAAPTPPPATAPEPATPVVVVTKPKDSPSDENQGRVLRIAGLLTVAVGVVAVGTGVGLALKTQSLSKGTGRSR